MQAHSSLKRGLAAAIIAAIGATLAAGAVLAADSAAAQPQAPATSTLQPDTVGRAGVPICPEGSVRVCTRGGCFCT